MIRNKIVIGLGLMLSLSAGVSFANSIGNSGGEVNTDVPFTLSLKDKFDVSAGQYYTITCQLNNIHNSPFLNANVELAKGSVSPVKINGVDTKPIALNKFEAPLHDGMNILVLNHVHPGVVETTDQPIERTRKVTKDVPEPYHYGWFSGHGFLWMFPTSGSNTVKKEVDEPYTDHQKITAKNGDDQLIFTAIDTHLTHMGTGYKVENCDAVNENGSTDATTTVDSTPVESTPVVEAAPVVEDAPAPVADAL